MEDIERVTPSQIETLRKNFAQKVSSVNAEFHLDDLDRVKNDDLWLRRFIAAQENDVTNATTMLFDTCQWRMEFGVNDLDHKQLLPSMVEKGTLFIRNKDNWGKHLLVFKAKTHVKGANDMEYIKKYIVYWFERIERVAKSDQISVVFDMKGTGWNNMDMDFIRYLITLLKQYYPHQVNYLMLFEMPWILNSVWNIIKGWLPPKFVERVKFVDKKSIKEYISVENQLAEWGGTDNYVESFQPEVRVRVRKTSLKPIGQKMSLSADDLNLLDSKSRKVQFTELEGAVDNHDLDSGFVKLKAPPQAAPRITLTNQLSPNQTQGEVVLVETNKVLVFDFDGVEYSGNISITNVTNENIIFKIKTTSPEYFRVKPTIGKLGIGTNASGSINVTSNGPINVRDHRFQVLAAILPSDLDASSIGDENDLRILESRLNGVFKTVVERRVPVYKNRLTCIISNNNNNIGGQGHEPKTNTTSGKHVTMNEEDMRKGLQKLEKKITDNLQQIVEENHKKIMTVLYGLLGLVIFFGLLTFFMIPSTSNIPVGTISGQCSLESMSSVGQSVHPNIYTSSSVDPPEITIPSSNQQDLNIPPPPCV